MKQVIEAKLLDNRQIEPHHEIEVLTLISTALSFLMGELIRS